MPTRKPLKTFLSAALLWGVCALPALATPILVHRSTESFYHSGATSVTNCTGVGCPQANFSFGNISGSIDWQVQEEAYRDTTAGTFSISYTVTNVAIPDGIDSFSVGGGGFLASSWASPTGWSFSQDSQGFLWSTNDVNAGIASGSGLAGLQIVFDDPGLAIVFRPATYDYINDVGMHVTLSSSDWMASSVATPEPGSLLLLASGLAGFAYLSRRRRASA